MKIKIDEDGNLWIERAGVLKLQECHMSPPVIIEKEYKARTCGDRCSLFNDEQMPESLELCRAYYGMDLEVIDERGKNDQDQ